MRLKEYDPSHELSSCYLWLYLSSCSGSQVGHGSFFRNKRKLTEDFAHADPGLLLGASLTLLGLIIGFTFSMAIGRYEQRKTYEEEEANAIGTEYVRADVLPAADAQRLRSLLANYTNQRISFYAAPYGEQLRRINADTAQLQTERPNPII